MSFIYTLDLIGTFVFAISGTLTANKLIIIACGCIGGLIFKQNIQYLRRTMFLFDTIGIGLFTILGLQKTLALDISPIIAVMMGSVSAVFGGVIRDVLCNEVPLIFRKEIYATACIFGACLFLILDHFNVAETVNMLITITAIIIIRILAVRYHWSLPVKA